MDATKLIEKAGRVAAQAAKQSALDSHYSPCTCSAPPRGHTTRQHDYRRLQVDELRAVLDVVERLTAALKASEEQNKATTISLRCAEANLKAATAETEPVKSANLAANKRIVELEQETDGLHDALRACDESRKELIDGLRTARDTLDLGKRLIQALEHERDAARAELARLTTPQPGEPLDMDCGDNSCMFATVRGGMRTNGGCRCLESLGFRRGQTDSLRRMAAEIVSLRKRLADLTTPRPIAEAPREAGSQIIALWMHGDVVESLDVVCWADMDDGDHPERKFWMNTAGDVVEHMTHYLPLPEVKP